MAALYPLLLIHGAVWVAALYGMSKWRFPASRSGAPDAATAATTGPIAALAVFAPAALAATLLLVLKAGGWRGGMAHILFWPLAVALFFQTIGLWRGSLAGKAWPAAAWWCPWVARPASLFLAGSFAALAVQSLRNATPLPPLLAADTLAIALLLLLHARHNALRRHN